MTAISNVIGDVTLWAHLPATYTDLNAAFTGGADVADLNRLCVLAVQTPLVLDFVTTDDPQHITFTHSAPQRYPALGHHYDNQFFALVGNDRDSTLPLRLREPKTVTALNLRAVPVDAHHTAMTAAGAPLFLPRLDWTGVPAAGQRNFFCHRILIVPIRFAQEAMALEAFHAAFIQPYMTEPAFLVNYAPLIDWWIAATTDRADPGDPASDRSHLEINVADDGMRPNLLDGFNTIAVFKL